MSATAFLCPVSPSTELLKLEDGLGNPPPDSYLAEDSVVGGSGGEVTLGTVNSGKLVTKGLELALEGSLGGQLWWSLISTSLPPQCPAHCPAMQMVPCPDPIQQVR